MNDQTIKVRFLYVGGKKKQNTQRHLLNVGGKNHILQND